MTMDLSVMNSETLFNEWFDSIWEVFPGRGSESTARKACHARIFKDKISHEILARAVSNYAEYVRAYRIPTEKSLHGSAFFGPRRYWETFSEGIPDYDGKLFDAPKFQRSSEKSSHGEFNDWFERVWEAYPRKIAKDQMKKACRARVNVDRIPMEVLEGAVSNYSSMVSSRGVDTKYIMCGHTFFGNGSRWSEYS